MIRKLLEKFINKKSNVTDYYPLQSSNSILNSILVGNKLSTIQALKWYRELSSVATAVDMIIDAVKGIDPVLKYKDEDYITEHPILEFLKQPNGFDTYNEFIDMVCKYYLITGNSYLSLLGNVNSTPIEMYSVNPLHLSIIPGEDGRPLSYNVNDGDNPGDYHRVTKTRSLTRYISRDKLKELYHISKFSSTHDRLQGDSPLNAIALELQQQYQGRIHNAMMLKQGGRLSMAFNFKEAGCPISEQQARKKMIEDSFGGSENAGKIAVFSAEDLEIQELGKSNKDMDYHNLDTLASQLIYLRYGIPLPLVTNEASTYNNVENAIIYFYENTVLPYFKEIFEGFNKVLLPRFQLDNNYQITYNPNKINPLMRQRLSEIERRSKMGLETINELRSLLPGREDVENGDILLVPSSSASLDEINNPQEENFIEEDDDA